MFNEAGIALPKETRFTKVSVAALPAELKQRALERVRHFVVKARNLYREAFEMPTVSFDQRGTTAGMAYPQKSHIRLNPVLFKENVQNFLEDTIPHEVAHLIAAERHGLHVQAHGAEWQKIMRDFGIEPSRCHSYDVTNARVGQSYAYLCHCGPQSLTSRQHATVMRGGGYSCRTCHQKLVAAPGTPTPRPRVPSRSPLTAPRTPPSARPLAPPTRTPAPVRPPSDRMVAYLMSLAKQRQLPIPPAALADFNACSQLIETWKSTVPSKAPDLPSERQLAYADAIARKKGLTLPLPLRTDRQKLSAWIDANK